MIGELDALFAAEEYSLPQRDKDPTLLDGLNSLTALHGERSEGYRRILDAAFVGAQSASALEDVPYLPVSLFKEIDLKSIADSDVFKVMQSSGTTSQRVSRIFLDVETAKLQTRALSSIMTHFIGKDRRPMIIVDHPDVVRDRKQFSARGAGILGMMSYGRDHFYALDESMNLDREGLESWLAEHEGEDLLIFGFTFMVWQYFYKPLADDGIDLSNASLIHSGGWKKLQDEAVSNETFKELLERSMGLSHVHNFYGMVEQVGSVFVECERGYFHPPNFADVIMRDPRTWQSSGIGEIGVVEVLSLLPLSYPGHALLTEDLGIVHGIDDCQCGQKGKYFTIIGRIPKAEIRGCSDTHAFSDD